MKEGISCLGIMLGLFALLILLPCYAVFAGGFVLAKIWLWYAVPLGFKAISWPVFGALLLAVGIIRPVAPQNIEGDKTKAIGTASGLLISPWFALLIAWILL